ncbi:hydroxysteroid 17-beta dehydrogenase 11 [Aspergillus steynii IBT 23096]|uniref:Short-chain dehydrogenase/reductase 3 n=1 Tax=Aspergillus steynii IBT 23096 TaxID=1392250 RepID=A0A2I2G6Q5_9EURO|nr:hydroxysteroid 17-beta dehydrogenase 11 [Aspergillus steynii IBT 23096]PLB48550.1 hydroxysteroid 17-beta dehydrogenase 11 [Aspergillus steynii IBT 23096]
MSLDQSLQFLRQWGQTALSHLPPEAQSVVLHPVVPKALAVLVGLGVARHANRALTRWTANNWQGAGPWQPARELVLITGGCSGIGKQIVDDLAPTGVRIVILDIQEPSSKLPTNATFYKADITSSASIAAVADKIRSAHGDPTVLVNNAGVGNDGTILEETEAKIRQTFEVNTISHFLMVREFLPSMVKQNHGHVITIASMASFVAQGEMVDYCCSKASALAFHEGLGQELRFWYNAPKVRTSVIHPLWVRTPMIKQLTDAGKQFRQPVLTPEMVSAAVVKQILTQSSGQVILPNHLTPISLVRAFPSWLQDAARNTGSKNLKRLREWQAAQAL